ncbi:MAG: dihydrofolate reductase family protein [Desulfurococcales archaeon]|nr:dihydrofolate reductase family protein [Desulfurococcales archaeon]
MRPYTIIFTTMTIDGRIADPRGFSKLSCLEDYKLQHLLRASVDGVMVGSNTALKDDPRLTVRLAPGKSPYRIVVDSRLRVPPTARIFNPPEKGIILTTECIDKTRINEYKRRGIIVISKGCKSVDLKNSFKELYSDVGIKKLMIEGGGILNYIVLSEGLVDEIWITVSPMIFGSGRSVFDGPDSIMRGLSLKEYKIICGGWVHLRYIVA